MGVKREVSPVVKVPLIVPSEQRDILRTRLFSDAQAAFQALIADYPEAFLRPSPTNPDRTDFVIRHDKASVRLCMASKDSGIEHEATLFFVTVEHGKPTSKLRPYDLVYLAAPT